MSYTIYGFRLGGDPECRYVGMTSRHPDDRLTYLIREAERRVRWQSLDPDGIHQWLLENQESVEAFAIAKVDTKAEAHATERAIVALVLRLGHRLFNHWLVPADQRIAWKPSRFHQKAKAA